MYNRYELGTGSKVVFLCGNPAIGIIKRVAKNGTWVDVYWIQDINRGYTSRTDMRYIRPLNGILNYWMDASKKTQFNFKNANGNFYLPPEH